MVTYIEILDSAIKIGLGALIGGITTYWVTKLNHEKELDMDRRKRKREILEEVASCCDRFSHEGRNCWALIANWVDTDDPKDWTDKNRRQIHISLARLYDSFHDMTSADGKLLLLGEVNAQTELVEYVKTVQNFYEVADVDNKELTMDKLNEHKTLMRDKRKSLLAALSRVYNVT